MNVHHGLNHLSFRLNQRILSSEEPIYVDVSGKPHSDLSNVQALSQLSVRDMTATLLQNLNYFTSKHSHEKVLGTSSSFLTQWIIADLDTTEGVQLLKNALLHMVSSLLVPIRQFSHESFRLEIHSRHPSGIPSECRRFQTG